MARTPSSITVKVQPEIDSELHRLMLEYTRAEVEFNEAGIRVQLAEEENAAANDNYLRARTAQRDAEHKLLEFVRKNVN